MLYHVYKLHLSDAVSAAVNAHGWDKSPEGAAYSRLQFAKGDKFMTISKKPSFISSQDMCQLLGQFSFHFFLDFPHCFTPSIFCFWR